MISTFASRCARVFGLLLVAMLLSTGLAEASQVTVNKQFSPNTVSLGGTSTVTITLQNNSTVSAANITAFSDDISTMGGVGQIASPSNLSNTCGGTPSITGTVVSMTNGSIQPGTATVPGSCTITFNVVGAAVGNGPNTIFAANVVTSNGSPAGDVTQTLTVNPINVTAAASPSSQTVQAGTSTTITYTITNPAVGAALTNVTAPIVATGSSAFTITNATNTCGGSTGTLPPAGTSGTVTLTGGTVPASGSCTVTLTVTSPSIVTVNFVLNANAITDAQNVTNSAAASGNVKFSLGQPNVTKSFNPTSLVPGQSTQLTINIQNVFSGTALTTVGESDALPGGFLLDAAAPITTNCGTPTISGAGTSTITISGGTIPANTTCTIKVTVDIPAATAQNSYTNTIPASNFTSDQVNGAAANATATLTTTGSGGGYSLTKAFSPTSSGPNSPILVTLTFGLIGTSTTYSFTNGSFTDNLPQAPVAMSYYTDATHQPSFTNCGSATPSVSSSGGGTIVTGSNLAVNQGGGSTNPCVVKFYVVFPNSTPVSRTDTNSITGASFTATVGGGTVTASSNNATVTEPPTLTVSNYVASSQGLINQPQLQHAQIIDSYGVTDSNAIAAFSLGTGGHVELAPIASLPASAGGQLFSFGANCPANIASYVNGTSGATSFTIGSTGNPIPSISATCDIYYYVIDVGGFVGSQTAGNSTYTSTLTGGTPETVTGTNSASFQTTHIVVGKKFTPSNQIQAGGNTTADITLAVASVSGFTTTQANGVTFADALPATMSFASPINVGFTAGCQQSGQTAPSYTTSGSTITFSNISLAVGAVTTGATCDVTFDVTDSTVGTPNNQIPVGSVTGVVGGVSTGITNTAAASASLTVSSGVGIAKTFLNSTFNIGGTDYVRLLITNSVATSTLTNGTLSDTMPSQLVLASHTEGPLQGGDPASCGGTIGGTIGSSTFTLSGLSVGPLAGAVPGQCVVYVPVTTASSATPTTVTNTIPIGGLTIGGYSNQQPTSAPVTLVTPPGVTISKIFTNAVIAPHDTSVLTISVANTASGSVPLTGLALTDTLPTNITIASTPNASTTCGSGTVSATAGGTSVGITGGSVGANTTCTITVSVTGTVIGNYTNTIPASAVTTTQGATNGSAATAPLQIKTAPSVSLSKAFAPADIFPGGTSILTISIANTASGSLPLAGMSLTDTLPANITIAATPNASTTCGSGTVSATAGGTTVGLTGGSIAASTTCTISVAVTGTVVGNYTNTIPAGAITTTEGASNPSPATAPLQISTVPPLTISKVFAPVSISPGETSTLTISIANTASGAIALTGMTLTDTLPANITIASTPNASTTCGTGTVAATAGGPSVVLNNAQLAAAATCTITVAVTGTKVGGYTNTIPGDSVTTTQGATNSNPATAPLTIAKPGSVTLAKSFSPTVIDPNGISLLTISVANTASGAIALSGVALTDTLPSGITIAPAPNAATTCDAATATVAATPGGTTVKLTNGQVAAAATCTITVNVTGKNVGKYTNTIPASALTTTQGVTNPGPATAPLTIGSSGSVTLEKSFSPKFIDPNGISKLTITILNTASGAIELTGLGLTDTLPAGITNAPSPDAATTCIGGTVAATARGSTVKLANGKIAANATCTITVNVTGKTVGIYTNTIPAGAVTTTQGTTNKSPVSAKIEIGAPNISVVKTSNPSDGAVNTGSTIKYVLKVTNSGSVPETDAKITDNLINAKLVSGSVRVDDKVAPDGIVTEGLSFGSVAAGATVKITYSATVNADAAPGAEVSNSVTVGGKQPCTGSNCTSKPPPNKVTGPALEISKTVNGVQAITASTGEVVTYGITVKNSGGSEAQKVVVSDAVPAGVVPIAGSVMLDGKLDTSATVVGQQVTIPLGTLASKATATITFRATVTANSSSGVITNTVTVKGLDIDQVTSNPVVITPLSTTIVVTKTASASVVSPGDRVDYIITATAPGGATYDKTTVVDVLPYYETYAPGTARVNGRVFEPVVQNQTLTWTLPTFHGTVTITYSAVIALGAPQNGTLTNSVGVTAQGPPGTKPARGGATATVQVTDNTLGSCYPITGRVFLDVKQSGRFEEGDLGVPGVSVYLDDGEYVQTDAYGRYNFPCVRPGMHAMRLDETTLPAGVVPYPDRNIDSEKSTRRLVHRGYDTTIIEDINFAVTGTPEQPLNPPSPPPPSPGPSPSTPPRVANGPKTE